MARWSTLYSFVVNRDHSSEDLSRFFNKPGVASFARGYAGSYRLIELGYGVVYWSGIVDEAGALVRVADTFIFRSQYYYNGYMAIQVRMNSTPEPRRPCKKCDPSCNSETGNPVRYQNGEIQLEVDDMSSLGFGLPWGQSRSYCNRLPLSTNYGNGYNWLVRQWAHLAQNTEGTGSVAVVIDPKESYWFDLTDGQYQARYGVGEQLVHVGDVFRFLRADGTVWEFSDCDQADQPGALTRVVGTGGNTLALTYQTDSTDEHAYVSTATRTCTVDGQPVIEQYDYAYQYVGGWCLSSITLSRQTGSDSPVNVAQVNYSYYSSSSTAGLDHGSIGDLRTVTTLVWSAETESWTETGTTYYRYYQGDSSSASSSVSSSSADADNLRSHMLKYVLNPDSYQRLVAAFPAATNVDDLTDVQLAPFADHYFEYDDSLRVTTEAIHGDLVASLLSYTTSNNADGCNFWKTKTVEWLADNSRNTVYSNYLGQMLLKEFQPAGNATPAIEYFQYDNEGRQILHATPAAVSGYNESLADLGGSSTILKASEGLVELTDYYTATTATETTAGRAAGYEWRQRIRQGQHGTPLVISQTTYFAHTVDNHTTFVPAQQTIFTAGDVNDSGITTRYGYTWHSGTHQIQERTTTLPVVSAGQNGSGTADTRVERFDTYGNRVWFRDERGTITHHEYDLTLSMATRTIQDVDGRLLTLPEGWTTPGGEGLHLITDTTFDDQGRTTQVLGPLHTIADPAGGLGGLQIRRAQWTVYDDAQREVRTAQGYAVPISSSGSSSSADDENYTFVLVNPVSITQQDAAGHPIAQIQAVRLSTAGKLTASDTFLQSSYVRWTTHQYGSFGQQLSTRVYHAIPTSGEGLSGTHYAQTTYGYDAIDRQNYQKTPGGTITRTTFDVYGHAAAVYVGTNDTAATDADPTGGNATSNNMVLVSESIYDGGGCRSCGSGTGNLTQQIQHVDAATTRVTNYRYDWRSRREYEVLEPDAQGRVTYTRTYYDNLNRPVKVERYYDADDDASYPSGSIDAGDLLLARSETSYDNRGRVYQTLIYAVADTGVVGNALVQNTWYDAAGHAIKQQSPGSQAFTKTVYDSLGRVVKTYTGYDTDETVWSDASSVADDTIVEQSETVYDDAGNVLETIQRQRLHNESETAAGALVDLSTSPKARATHIATWYDGIGQQVASANYGALSSPLPSGESQGEGAFSRPVNIPARSDTVLVHSVVYNSRGEAYQTIDPAGKITYQEFDASGRVTKQVRNYVDGVVDVANSDEDVTVTKTYNLDGQLATLTAVNPTTGNQTTTYVHGTTLTDSSVARGDLLVAEVYPDSVDSTDRVTYTYNRQGQQVTKTDQNGTVHTYSYDSLGRQLSDAITTVGTGVDVAVRRIATAYNVRGQVDSITSYDSPTAGGVVSQVAVVYNAFGQVIAEYQAHGGAVDTSSTPKVGYAYSDGSANHVRLLSMTYPNGRVLHYGYDSGMDDALSRVSFLADPSLLPGEGWGEGIGQHLAEYDFLGLGSFVRVTYPEPDLRWDLIDGTGSDPYGRMDQFGRVVEHIWRKCNAGTNVVLIRHGYDRVGNRLWRDDVVAKAAGQKLDELYTYDGMSQLVSLDRGQLNSTNTGLVSNTKTFAEAWSLDMTGNWSGYREDTDGDGTWNLNQSRTYGAANEITATSGWATPGYDRNGNMTTIPQPSDPTQSYTCVYDGWNRLVRMTDGSNTVAEYRYDGRNFRIVRAAYADGVLSEVRHFYLNSQNQVLEERVGTSTVAQRQNVWGLRYVDNLVLRDRDSDSSDSLDERLYALQDANWNVVAMADSSGVIVERYAYSAYGKATISEPDWSGTLTTSAYNNTTLYTGRELDVATGFYCYRARYYIAELGVFVGRDPLGYDAGDASLYRYVGDAPAHQTDPTGLEPPGYCTTQSNVVWSGMQIPRAPVWVSGVLLYLSGSVGSVNVYSHLCPCCRNGAPGKAWTVGIAGKVTIKVDGSQSVGCMQTVTIPGTTLTMTIGFRAQVRVGNENTVAAAGETSNDTCSGSAFPNTVTVLATAQSVNTVTGSLEAGVGLAGISGGVSGSVTATVKLAANVSVTDARLVSLHLVGRSLEGYAMAYGTASLLGYKTFMGISHKVF
jgi:RHS repeat-associated protein